MKKWYELNLDERKREVYNNYTIKDFWEWWSDKQNNFMEIRVDSDYFPMMVEYAKQYKLPFAKTGIFVNSAFQLRKVIEHFNDKCKLWFGINPRRRLPNKYGKYKFSGKDINIEQIKFLFIDIDRKVKEGPATKESLMNADFLADKVMEQFAEGGFNKNYVKICSGNGVQLLIKLDVPIEIPFPKFNEDGGMYIEDSLFLDAKHTIYKGIGKVLPAFSKQFEDDYDVEIDSTGFNMNRVGAVPHTYNFKFDQKIPRGIVELRQDGQNEGFADYLRDIYKQRTKRESVKKDFKTKTPVLLSNEQRILKNNLRKNVIIELMLNFKFPEGGINNTLWYATKLLMHDSGIDNTDNEYIQLHQTLKQLHDRNFSDNGLEPQFKNSYEGPFKKGDINVVPAMVNKYLRLHYVERIKDGKKGLHPPLFPVLPFGKIPCEIKVSISPKYLEHTPKQNYQLSELKEDPLIDITEFKKELQKIRRGDELEDQHVINDYKFTAIGETMVKKQLQDKFVAFLHAMKEKWGQKTTLYMMKHYMEDYLNNNRW